MNSQPAQKKKSTTVGLFDQLPRPLFAQNHCTPTPYPTTPYHLITAPYHHSLKTSQIDWCCFHYFVGNSLAALLEALCARPPHNHKHTYNPGTHPHARTSATPPNSTLYERTIQWVHHTPLNIVLTCPRGGFSRLSVSSEPGRFTNNSRGLPHAPFPLCLPIFM